jgi:hypothetical protein
VPPNQAATRPPGVSAIVEAWHDANGACSKTNSLAATPAGFAYASPPEAIQRINALPTRHLPMIRYPRS